jgi:intermediate cleaving peptidase 55
MRRSGQIAGLAHNSTMRFSNTGLARSEWDLERHFEYVSGLLGATRMAYVPVVAGGERGCTIHYTDNDHLLDKVGGSSAKKGEGHLVTMDAGVEYAGYTSDITRAWPVSFAPRGESSETVKWTTPQLHLYEALLRVLKECTACCTEDQGYTQRALHTKSVDLLRVELKDLGIDLKAGGDLEKILYPHYLSHNLGLDLHDVPSPTSRTSLLALGQTLTIEPGLYIPPLGSLQSHRLSSFIPDHFRGIGMRVEDDVAVGSDRNQGPVVLSQEAVKEVQDIIDVCEGRERKDFASTDQHGSSYLGREVDQILTGKRSL